MSRKSDTGREREGRCSGDGADYVPWILNHEFSGNGKKHKFQSLLFDRLRQCHSTIEYDFTGIVERGRKVKDSKEHFKMDLSVTLSIAKKLGIKHPLDIKRQIPKVMTIDHLIEFEDGRKIAVSVKSSADLGDQRVLEKLEIERIYFTHFNIHWLIITEHQIPTILRTNFQILYNATFSKPKVEDFQEKIEKVYDALVKHKNSSETIGKVVTDISIAMKIPSQIGWKCFLSLCAANRIIFNYYSLLTNDLKIYQFTFPNLA